MTARPALDYLRSLPLFRGFSDVELDRLAELFQPIPVHEGEVLFDIGARARAFYVLTAGEVVLRQDDEELYRLRPPVLIGELGAVTGLPRNCQAIVGPGAELYQVESSALTKFVEVQPALGLRFQHALLEVAADKIARDQRRIEEMRHNLIRTQKAMKRMRDFILESQDTVVSREVHDTLTGLIEQNRRVNYRVEPPAPLAARVRLDDGRIARVTQISRTHVSFVVADGALPATDDSFAGVLQLAGPEIPISGTVLRTRDRRVDLALDLLLDEYVATLEGYLTRVQMQDFLV